MKLLRAATAEGSAALLMAMALVPARVLGRSFVHSSSSFIRPLPSRTWNHWAPSTEWMGGPPSPRPRRFSLQKADDDDDWRVPKTVEIPVDKIDFSFVRSSGAGGQNVNKVSTKVELRFPVLEAEWLPLEVRQRLCEQQRGRISKKGLITIQSQEFRTQEQNKKAAVAKLREMILEAYPRPKVRTLREGISEASKVQNKEFKRRRSAVKQNRGQVGSKDW